MFPKGDLNMRLVKMFGRSFAIMGVVLFVVSLLLTAFLNTSTVYAQTNGGEHVHSEQCVHEAVAIGEHTHAVMDGESSSSSSGTSIATKGDAIAVPSECGCGCKVYACTKCWKENPKADGATSVTYKNVCPGIGKTTAQYSCPLDITNQKWYKSMMQVVEIVDGLLTPILIIGGSVGAIFVIVLGVNFSKAESADKREEAKKRMINAIIGVVATLLLLILIKIFTSNAESIVTWINKAGNQ